MAAAPLALLSGVVVLVLALSACTGSNAPPSQASPVPTAALTATAPPTTPSPEPTEQPPSIATATVDAIPSRFRYAVLSWGPVTRVWLVDLQARVAPRLVIRLEHMEGCV